MQLEITPLLGGEGWREAPGEGKRKVPGDVAERAPPRIRSSQTAPEARMPVIWSAV